jgi:polysaccharide export outer membrane protein
VAWHFSQTVIGQLYLIERTDIVLKGKPRFGNRTNEQPGRQANASALFIGLRSQTQTKIAILLLLFVPVVYAQSSGEATKVESASTTSAASPDTVRQLLAVRPPQLIIASGDSIRVEVFEIEKYNYTPRVDADGQIAIPLVDSVKVLGLTATEAEKLIADRLEDRGMVKNPHVHVTLVEQPSQTITISGEVYKPGVFPAFGAKTLIGAISLAGGLKDTASRNVTLLRPATGQTYVINLGDDPKTALTANIPLFKGDTVIVGVVGVVYVVGAVKNSGVYRLKNSSSTTLRQVIAMAGGTGYEAKLSKTVVIRNDDGRQAVIPVAINKDVSKPVNDITLESNDIVYVPTSNAKAAVKGGGLSIAAIVASAALYRN